MKLSLTLFGRDWNFGVSKMSPDMAAFLGGNDSEGVGAQLVSPYSQSSWVFIAISCLAENVAQIPLRISKVPQSAKSEIGKQKSEIRIGNFRKRVLGENIIESGAVVDLFNHPHATMDRALFWETVVSWKALRGEFFVAPLDAYDQPIDLAGRAGKVASLLPLNPQMFWHMVKGYELTGWRYTGSPLMSPLPSEVMLPSEVIHHRTFNPFLYWRGMSPLLLAQLAAMTDYAASQFMKGLMTNNADTGVIVTTDQQLSAEQREQMIGALRERKRKAGTADRPLLMWGGAKLEKPTLSSADMEFLANRKFNREEIFSVFKVPPSMAGIETASGGKAGGASGSSSGGSQQQDRRVFIENTISNFCRQLEAAFAPVVKRFDPSLELWFDVDSLPIMQEARRDRLDAAAKAFALGVPLNDLNTVYDLGFDEYAWGDTGYLPFNLQAAGNDTATDPQEPGLDANEPGNPELAAFNPISRAESFLQKLLSSPAAPLPAPCSHVCHPPHGFEASIAGSVRQKHGKLKKFFFEQRGRVLSKLASNYKFITLSADQDGKSEIITRALEDLWNAKNEDGKLVEKLKPLLLGDLDFGGTQIWQEIAAANEFNLAPQDAIDFLDKRANVISDINATTWNSLKSSLQEGLGAGESYDELAQRVKTVFSTAGDSRAATIALTETQVAINSGRQLAMEQAGVERKGWLTSHLENTRLTHIENEQFSDKNNGIAIDDIWPNGCAYPGDPAGEPGETINCRCVGYAMAAQKSVGTGSTPSQIKFLRFEEWTAARSAKGGAS